MPPNSPDSRLRSRIMKANRRSDTGPELAVRRALHARGLRFRKDFPIRVPGERAVRPDVVFTRRRVALFIDGCWWHGCPEHGTQAATNAEYWGPKLAENRDRDRRQTAVLKKHGWTVIRAWAHEDPAAVAARVTAALDSRGGS